MFNRAEHAAHSVKHPMLFMSVGDSNKWQKMKTNHDHLDKDGMWRDDVDEIATAFVKDGHIFFVLFERSSPSGDWNDDLECAYRSDGSLLMTKERYAAFAPEEGAVNRVTMYTPQGGIFTAKSSAENLKGKKVSDAKAHALMMNANAVAPAKPLAKSVRDLPFLSAMKK